MLRAVLIAVRVASCAYALAKGALAPPARDGSLARAALGRVLLLGACCSWARDGSLAALEPVHACCCALAVSVVAGVCARCPIALD